MMRMLCKKLYRIRLLTPVGLWQLLAAVITTGINLMALLRWAAKLHPQRLAIVDDRERLTYAQLWQQAESLACALQADYGIRQGQRVAIATHNHSAGIKAIFATARLGAHVYLLNPDIPPAQLLALHANLRFDFYCYDAPLPDSVANSDLAAQSLPTYHPTAPSIDRLTAQLRQATIRRAKPGNIVVMTGGTTGQPKPASRKPSALSFLPPFVALLTQVHLDRYRRVYIATPIYHGYGLATLLIGIVLGAQQHITQRFQTERACALIHHDHIEVVTLVPLMLRRMLQHDATALAPLQCIVTGGAALRADLAQQTLTQLGPILFNLYGTSEAGFCIMAPPTLLAQKPDSIGQPVNGVQARIVDKAGQIVAHRGIGQLCIRSAWATSRSHWVETGDLAYRDPEGNLFLCGRVDDMIVSGGENVYPIELEQILQTHPLIDAVAVVGIADPEFGQRLKAVIVCQPTAELDADTLRDWLQSRVARHQMPAVLEFRESLPYTSLGKLDKKALLTPSR